MDKIVLMDVDWTLRYSSEYGDQGSRTELAKINERLRSYQPPRDTTAFRSRFLRSSQDTAVSAPSASTSQRSTHADDNAKDDSRSSVSSLRRRYDLNRNHLTDSRSLRNSVLPTTTILTTTNFYYYYY